MAKRIILYTLFSILMMGVFFSEAVVSRTLGEDEKLIWVGTGAFNDGFYDIAEKQFSQFLLSFGQIFWRFNEYLNKKVTPAISSNFWKTFSFNFYDFAIFCSPGD